jgi:hypothetical protein
VADLISNDVLEIIEQVFPGNRLEIYIDSDWGSQSPNFRSAIREGILVQASKAGIKLNDEEAAMVLDLAKHPRPKSFRVSISHSVTMGGFAFEPANKKNIGFDLEFTQRIQTRLVARMSSPKEMQASPSPPHLWVAKEASYKALSGMTHLKTLSQIETSHWIPLKNNFWVFRCSVDGNVAGKGLSGPLKQFHLGLFESST